MIEGPPPPPLEYRSTADDRGDKPSISFRSQMLFGFLAWISALTATWALANNLSGDSVGYIVVGAFAAVLGTAIYLRIRFHWRGFFPGLAIGFGLTCLIPIGMVAVICGFGR